MELQGVMAALRQFVCLLGFTKLVLNCQCLRFLTTGFAGEELGNWHTWHLQYCITDDAWRIVIRSPEVRACEP
jgi:hypothetical protein